MTDERALESSSAGDAGHIIAGCFGVVFGQLDP